MLSQAGFVGRVTDEELAALVAPFHERRDDGDCCVDTGMQERLWLADAQRRPVRITGQYRLARGCGNDEIRRQPRRLGAGAAEGRDGNGYQRRIVSA